MEEVPPFVSTEVVTRKEHQPHTSYFISDYEASIRPIHTEVVTQEEHQPHTSHVISDYESPTRPMHTETDHFRDEYLRTPPTDHSFKHMFDSSPLSSRHASSIEPSIHSDDDDDHSSIPDDTSTHEFHPIKPPPFSPTPKEPKKVRIEDDHFSTPHDTSTHEFHPIKPLLFPPTLKGPKRVPIKDDHSSIPDNISTHEFHPIKPSPFPSTPKRPKKVPIKDDHSGISKAIPTPLKPITPDSCLQDICKQYSIDLQMNRAYFNFRHNKCYCSQCYPSTKTDHFTVANSIYTAPRGWVRFGLQIDEAFADDKHIFKQWYTTFYGTSRDKLELILRQRFIPFPGDTLLSGEIFTTHLPDKDHVYTSPSIYYASFRHVCPTHTAKINDRWYDVQVVLECKQNPKGIIKQRGYRPNVCRIIPNDEIEWKTNQRSSVVPYGLLIRAQEHRCTDKCTHTAISDPSRDKPRGHVKSNDDVRPHASSHMYDRPVVSDRCPENICKQYSIDLRMNRAYFNFRHNICFCLQCYPSTQTDHFTVAGSIYTVPRSWVRFGLQIDQAFADAKQIFKRWYTTFYGTSRDKLEPILRQRFIPFPGDPLLSGEIFTTHLRDKDHVYTSPSIHYASLRHVCPTHTTKINSQWYDVQVVLECKQNPKGIIKQRGYRPNVCLIIPNDEIEWKTNQRSSVVPYGLLIHVREHRCTYDKCALKHSS